MSAQSLAIIFLVGIFLFVLELVRQEKLTFKYASGWFLICLAGIFFAVFKKYLFAVSDFLGFQLPSNFIFFALFAAFVLMSLFLTIFLCQQNSRNDIMAQKIARIEFELKTRKENPPPQEQKR